MLESIISLIQNEVHDNAIQHVDETSTPVTLHINKAFLIEVAQKLYTNPQADFDCLSCITALDNGFEQGSMEVIYHLYSIPFNHSLALKIVLPRNKPNEPLPTVDSLSSIWKGALWHEREAYDLLGIHFENHPDLRRILMPADWQGYPLRKDYEIQDQYHDIKVDY